MNDLFREEALDYQSTSRSLVGRPTHTTPPAWSHITWLLALFIVALVTFLFSVDFARKETVRGRLRVDGAEAKLFPLTDGIVSELFVQDGDLVDEGNLIAKISSEQLLEDGERLSTETVSALEVEQQSMRTQRASAVEAFALEASAADHALTDAVRKSDEVAAQRALVVERLRVAEQRRDSIAGLRERGLVAEPLYNDRLEAVAALRQALLEMDAQIADQESAQVTAKQRRREAQIKKASELATIDQRMAQIDKEISLAKASSSHIIAAPVSGRIVALRARIGESASTGIPLATILPSKANLAAEVFLPSRAAGFVSLGQTVKLQYDAFPYQKFGVANGTISAITAVAQPPKEIGVIDMPAEPVYRVDVALEKQSVPFAGKEFRLQPGMELTANIVLEDRRLIEWIISPFKH